ncbi:portal protein [Cellulophaga phage phi17:1]|uniref:Phage portal protein n=1 Tax=Cellulophaga phage phi17:1 TaxID=1327980 RepID=S0A263_9CAUD|nr:portal protein [Cellulophaga phage phi17:1]AGO48313.1 phage portal protein [Cellulophaga phage phi17:1]
MNIFKKTALFLMSKAMGPQLQYSWASGQWLYPGDNKDTYIDKGYKDIPNLYGIISLIISKSSIVPFEVYRVTNKTEYNKYKTKLTLSQTPKDIANCRLMMKSSLDKVEGSEIEQLLHNPNSEQTLEELWEQLDGYKLLTGDSYLWAWTPGVGVNANKPQELHVPPATMVSIVTGGAQNPVKEYKLSYASDPIEAQDMAHFKIWNPLNSGADPQEAVYGMSPLISCRRLMQRYKDADISQGAMFKNQGPAGILSAEKDAQLTEPQATAVKDRWSQLYKGSDKAGQIVITSAAMKWNQIGFSPVDMNTIEAKSEMLGELCNVYHVPIGLFSDKNSTENNMVESRKALITDAVIPLIEARKGILNKWLCPKFGDDLVIEFDYTVFSEISMEVKSLADSAAKMWWTSPNEKREMTGWDKMTDPNMDKVYVPSGLSTLESINRDPMELDVDPLMALEDDEDEEIIEEEEGDDA